MSVLSSAKRSGVSTIVGLLACQKDPYLQTLKTKVLSCEQVTDKSGAVKGYEVELEDTVLFPEGGGQPYDTGMINDVKVHNVQRDGLTAVHLMDSPVEPGAEVSVKVDWNRRLDHMQQHTGQHLLSAVLDKRKIETVSWNLGAKFCYIELPRKLSQEEVNEVQAEVNEYIRAALPIRLAVNEDANGVEHSIPEDYDLSKGVVRVVHIGDLDSNPCCGTHLKSTADISALSLLHSMPIRGTNSRLFFIAGERVNKYASEAHDILRRAGAGLSCQPEELEDKINKVNQTLKELYSREKFWSGQVAKLEAAQLKSQLEAGSLAVLHKPEGTMDYLKNVEKELGKFSKGTLVLISGQGKQGGAIVASGENIDKCVEVIKDAVPNVKGGGKGKWQGKVPAWEKGSLDKLLEGLKL